MRTEKVVWLMLKFRLVHLWGNYPSAHWPRRHWISIQASSQAATNSASAVMAQRRSSCIGFAHQDTPGWFGRGWLRSCLTHLGVLCAVVSIFLIFSPC